MVISKLLEKLAKVELTDKDLNTSGVDLSAVFSRPCVAVVGSRKPTPYGIAETERIVEQLSRAGVAIISGLAFGIDATAHRTALRAGGVTIAILPSGLNAIYPVSHHALAHDIARSGMLISTYESNHKPRKHDFLNRNRLIAALSDAVIIPEAANRSGSLNTARHAVDLNVPVFAVPGRNSDHMSQGTNQLIAAHHAQLLSSIDDILNLFGSSTNDVPLSINLSLDERATITLLQTSPSDTTGIQAALQKDITEIQSILTRLELQDLVQLQSSGQWRVKMRP